jgi:hypothetical protein
MGSRTARRASKIAISAISLLMLGTITVPQVQASSFSMVKKQIYDNNQLFSAPGGFVARDPASNEPTTYLPIWYIQQLLQKLFGIQQTWDGHNWKLTIPASFTVSTFPFVQPSQDSSKRVVYVNNKPFECPSAIVTTDLSSGQPTTYFPMWYIEQVLHLIGIQDSWDGTNWRMSNPASAQTSGSADGSSSTSNADNSSSASATGTSNASGNSNTSTSSNTMGTLNASGSTGAASATDNAGEATANPSALKVRFQNAAVDDSSWWTKAGTGIYIAAQTENPKINTDPAVGSEILNVQPGDKLYLFAYSDSANVPKSETAWAVNSADATITPDGQDWKVNEYQAAGAVFVTTEPGVYTVQANIAGANSVPLVITVGLAALKSGGTGTDSMATSADTQGIRPLPAGLTPVQTADNGTGTSGTLYAPDGNWIPLSGKTTPGLKFVTVLFGGSLISPDWSYNIPVQSDGSFAAELKSPVAGQTTIDLYTNYIQDLTMLGNGQSVTDMPVQFSVQLPTGAVNLPPTALDLMPTAKMDFNLNPAFATTAEILFENAPSVDSGIEAVNNYVSDLLTYDMTETQPNLYRFQDSETTWNTRTGICEDYAELEASLLKSIGIRAETVLGSVPESSTSTDLANTSGDNHEWVQAWDGEKWVVADPTWSSDDDANTAIVTNQFFTNTQSFQSTHTTDSNGIGTTFSRRP